MTFLSKVLHFHSRKCTWKCRLRNGVHFVSASVCKPNYVLFSIFALYHMPALLITYQKIIQNLFSLSSLKLILIKKFHGNFWTTLEQHLWFHGISWNFSIKTSSSMEFYPDPKFQETFSILPSSMELLIFPKKVPWNSIEFLWSSMEFHGTWCIWYLKKSHF